MRLDASMDRQLVPAGIASTRYVHLKFQVPELPRAAVRPPLAVALVLDRSGSMQGEKFALARQAVDRCLGLLGPKDQVALFVFDDQVDRLLELDHATPATKARGIGRLSEVEPRGSTDLFAGWFGGAEEVALSENGQTGGRVILLTDGLANHGTVEPTVINHFAHQFRTRQVVTSTFGVGADFDERLLEGMAESGGGNFYYLERPEAMLDMLATELDDALAIVAHEAAVVLDLDEDVVVESPADWPVVRTGRSVRVALGSLVSGQEVELVLTLRIPARKAASNLSARLSLVDRDSAIEATEPVLEWKVVAQSVALEEVANVEVQRAVARAYASRARREAAEHNRNGELDAARRVLESTARRIAGYAGDDRELQQLVVQLTNEAREHMERFDGVRLKERHFAMYAERKVRDSAGRSRRKR